MAEHARDAIFDSAASIIGCGKTDIIAAFTRIWALSWDNVYKEVFWALIYDAYPTAERLGQQWTCGCGAATPGRLHHFWECPVACNMVLEIQRHLPHSTPQLQIVHIWLCQSPGEFALDAWLGVALAALPGWELCFQLNGTCRDYLALMPQGTMIQMMLPVPPGMRLPAFGPYYLITVCLARWIHHHLPTCLCHFLDGYHRLTGLVVSGQ